MKSKFRNLHSLLLFCGLSLVLLGCVKEPEGPGEQIGRGLDLITKGLGEIEPNTTTETPIQRHAREKEEERLRRQAYDDANRDLGHDPYYDTPSSSNRKPYSSEDYDSSRRY